jgi:hypothetical protein
VAALDITDTYMADIAADLPAADEEVQRGIHP